MTPLALARQVLDIELAGLKAVRSQLDAQFTAAVEILAKALAERNKLVVVGIGKSGNIGQKIAATFNSTCLLYTSPSPRDLSTSRMPSSA